MRTNKNTETVFLDVLDTQDKIGKLSKFLKGSNFMDPNENKYKDIIDEISDKLEEAACLEEIILQTRAWKNLKMDDIKITANITKKTEYLYARVPFYRSDKSAKEIRVLIGRSSDWLSNTHPSVEDLHKDLGFLTVAHNSLSRAMELTIHNNVDKYKTKFQKIKA